MLHNFINRIIPIMKNYWFLLLCILCWLGCEQRESASADNERPAVAAENAVGTDVPTTDEGSSLAPVAPPELPETDLLLRDHWVIEYWVSDDPAAQIANKGRWWKFAPDGTFDTGLWEDQLARGSWSLYQEDGKTKLRLDANVDRLDAEFELQGFTPEGDYMSWVGTPTFNQQGVIVKAMLLMSRPTKKQFGVAE